MISNWYREVDFSSMRIAEGKRLLVRIVSVLPLAENFAEMFCVPSGNLTD
jgi:hypothetical protein